MLLENPNAATIHNGCSSASSINNSNCSLNGQLEKTVRINDGTVSHAFNNGLGKRNSIDSPISYQPNFELRKNNYNQSISESHTLLGNEMDELHLPLQHRRSLSENVITFPPHTTPSDKARCHQLNRSSSRCTEVIIDENIATYSNLTLRKVAETMFLKDPQYKPRPKEDSKPNPFAALAQLRGVKKILGANPTTYTPGVGDLFSSCFEMSSPFLTELSHFNNKKLTDKLSNADQQPKSLPNSPASVRKDFKVEPMVAKNLSYEDKCCAGISKSYKANFNELSSHPLYKNGKSETDPAQVIQLLAI